MNTTTAYTPLESLLLFQSLAAYGTAPDVFSRISDLLKKNVLVRDGDTYDPGRLSPDALRELYVQLLREELRNEAAEGDSNGDASPSKKRKLPSPPLPNIKEASEYSDRIPQLVNRLYGRYRDHMLRLIREDERRYEILTREVDEIERGEWDDRIVNEDKARKQRQSSASGEDSKLKNGSSKSPVTRRHTLDTKQEAVTTSISQDGKESQPTQSYLSQHVEDQSESLAIRDGLDTKESMPPQSPKISEHSGNASQGPMTQQGTASADRLQGPSPLQPAQQRPAPPGTSSESWKWEQYQGVPPQQPQSYHSNSNYPQYSPSPYPPQQYPPYGQPPSHRGSFPGPGAQPPLPLPSHPHGRVPSSPLNASHPNPIVLPPPNLARGSGSPAAPHLDQLANAAEQQYRASSGSPMMQQGSMPGTPMTGPPYGQGHTGYPPQQYRDGRPPSGNGVSAQWNQQYSQPYPAASNYGYPPPAPPLGQRPFIAGPELQPQPRQYNSPYNPSQGTRPMISTSAVSTPRPRQPRESGPQPNTPASLGRSQYRTGKATAWTPETSASTPKAPRSPTQPAYEPLSPVLPPLKPSSRGSARKVETSTGSRGRRSGRGSYRGTAGSIAPTAIGRAQRSQSVTSHADELSLDTDAESRKVKQESSTPLAIEETGDTTADEAPPRRRREQATHSSPRRVQKRKRQNSKEPEHKPIGPPTQVAWTRNFPKISASALERIGAHRSASTFALPIKERDAPGYRDVILRPQDLKSIRSSVVAGSKAGAAVVVATEDQGQPSVTLPISEDLVPPKGIVNNSQLEKELMLMFANAIMFNPDPHRGLGKAFEYAQSVEDAPAESKYDFDEDGVVKETKAMFADVEKIVSELRSAERRSEERSNTVDADDEVDELAGEIDHGGSVAKRRKRG